MGSACSKRLRLWERYLLGLIWLFCGAIALGREQYEQLTPFRSQGRAYHGRRHWAGHPVGLPGAIVGFAIAQGSARSRRSFAFPLHTGRRAGQHHPRAWRWAVQPAPRGPQFRPAGMERRSSAVLNYRLDLFILAALATRADVGRYSLAVSLTMLRGSTNRDRTGASAAHGQPRFRFRGGGGQSTQADRAIARDPPHGDSPGANGPRPWRPPARRNSLPTDLRLTEHPLGFLLLPGACPQHR